MSLILVLLLYTHNSRPYTALNHDCILGSTVKIPKHQKEEHITLSLSLGTYEGPPLLGPPRPLPRPPGEGIRLPLPRPRGAEPAGGIRCGPPPEFA